MQIPIESERVRNHGENRYHSTYSWSPYLATMPPASSCTPFLLHPGCASLGCHRGPETFPQFCPCSPRCGSACPHRRLQHDHCWHWRAQTYLAGTSIKDIKKTRVQYCLKDLNLLRFQHSAFRLSSKFCTQLQPRKELLGPGASRSR